jgi:fumarylpyruvate hydrolase
MLIPQVTVPSLAIAGSAQRFPVRRIYCVGRNYAEHAREMGGDPVREPPFFFSKPADAVVATGGRLVFPCATADLHYEVEMVVALGQGGAAMSLADAARCVFGFAVGIDLTRRDMQAQAKKTARPWDLSKGFDQSAPVGALTVGAAPNAAALSLRLDGVVRQEGNVADMLWKTPEIIAALSLYVSLAPGDLVFTGTPAGVGPVARGQTLHAELKGAAPLELEYLE